ncbi:S49 family peptidase [Nissabacter sp. SGAir0207]|uniref:S49 family peptidase n=1 Tax=Nissabacter sp. SGAir0207 TaxID=2126321 RepID=UPI0010CCD733|nr:S49 family peptidase [Nissabacter sp. SGAir0207]QCR38953.1 serine peptidase [Nissabacter sp. SGAir0207]
MNLPHLAQRLFNTPLALHPLKAEVVMAALSERFGITRIHAAEDSWADRDADAFTRQGRDAGYDVVGGIAIIPIHGTLVQKLGRLRPYSGMTGYDGIRQAFLTALTDSKVKGIMLDIDSPGGEVAGCFDLVDEIYRARGTKPIWSVLTESAYSAGYALASAADRIVLPRTGGVGSVGVIVMHVDWTQKIKDDGLAVTIITYGDRKAESTPYRKLSEQARAAIQQDVNDMGQLFVSTVARNRGISEKILRETQAATFSAANGVELGLADAIAAPDAAFRALLKHIGEDHAL